MKCYFQRGETKLNRTLHLSLNENICTMLSFITLINLYILENAISDLVAPCQAEGHCSEY